MPRCAKIIKYSQKNDKRLEKCKSGCFWSNTLAKVSMLWGLLSGQSVKIICVKQVTKNSQQICILPQNRAHDQSGNSSSHATPTVLVRERECCMTTTKSDCKGDCIKRQEIMQEIGQVIQVWEKDLWCSKGVPLIYGTSCLWDVLGFIKKFSCLSKKKYYKPNTIRGTK